MVVLVADRAVLHEFYSPWKPVCEVERLEGLPVRWVMRIKVTGVAGENAHACARWIKLEWNENWRPPIREERGLWSQVYGNGLEARVNSG